MVTSAKQWKGKIQTEGSELDLPSGNTALVRQIAPTAFLAQGFMPDPLSAIVRQNVNAKSGMPPKALQDMVDSPEQLGAAMETFDRVLCHVVVEPAIVMPPACDVDVEGAPCGEVVSRDVHKDTAKSGHHQYHEGARDGDTLYADQVALEDKMFVFQWALGGTRDLERFREEQQQSVANLSDGKKVRGAAKRPARAR